MMIFTVLGFTVLIISGSYLVYRVGYDRGRYDEKTGKDFKDWL